jgi:hypothetical protein
LRAKVHGLPSVPGLRDHLDPLVGGEHLGHPLAPPSRPLVVPLMLTYDVLVIALGLGVWGSAGAKRALRVVGGLLVAYGVVGLTGPFSPIHLLEVLAAGEETLTDTMHGIITMVLVLFMLVAIGFGAAAFGKWFRLYSIATVLLLAVFGVLTGLDQPQLVADLPTPWMGVWERIVRSGALP